MGWIVFSHDVAAALLAAVAVLVVACPCALGLATPLAMTITLGRTAQAGILVRNPAALETAAHIQRMVFDKTGTLTRGKMTVREVHTDPAIVSAPDMLSRLAAAVEQFSEHPIARAIVEAYQEPLPQASEFKSLAGLGASARIDGQDGQRVMVGSSGFLDVQDDSPLTAQAKPYIERGETVVWVGWANTIAGFIVLRDEPNPTASQALHQIHEAGIQTVMLSGDNPGTTAAIGVELGLDAYEGIAFPRTRPNASKPGKRRATRSPWSAMGSTMPPRWPRPI